MRFRKPILKVRALSSLGSTPVFMRDTSSVLAHTISWRPPDEGIILVELYGGIGTRLAAVLEVGLMVRQYIYVDDSQVSTRVAHHQIHQLMMLYSQQLDPSAIHGCFACLPVMLHLLVRETYEGWVPWIW